MREGVEEIEKDYCRKNSTVEFEKLVQRAAVAWRFGCVELGDAGR